jgi:hypothetical protein
MKHEKGCEERGRDSREVRRAGGVSREAMGDRERRMESDVRRERGRDGEGGMTGR